MNATTKNITNTALLTVGVSIIGMVPDVLASQDYVGATILSVVGIAVIFFYSVLP